MMAVKLRIPACALLLTLSGATGCDSKDSSKQEAGDSEADPETEADKDTGADADADADADTYTDTDTDVDSDTGVDSDTDCWFDATSGLTWQVVSTGGQMDWASATSHCENLNLCGSSDWTLPSVSQLRSLIRGCEVTETGGPCGLTDQCAESCYDWICVLGCNLLEAPDSGCYWPTEIQDDCSGHRYWSSSSLFSDDTSAWIVGFYTAYIDAAYKAFQDFARCVRAQ